MFLLIDCNNLAFINFFALLNDMEKEEEDTFMIFGFLAALLRLQKQFNPDAIVFAWDSRISKRKKIYPEYKANRKAKTDENKDIKKLAYKQMGILRREVIPNLGFINNICKIGYEADDIIAYASKKYNNNPNVIVSTDQDLYQLLDAYTRIYNPSKKKMFGYYDLINEYKVDPTFWSKVKAIAGCSSDNIKGFDRVGEKTAIKYLRNLLDPSHKTYKEIKNNPKLIEDNLKLTHLPFDDKLNFELYEQPILKKMDFIEVFEKFKMESFLKQKAWLSWCDAFKLE